MTPYTSRPARPARFGAAALAVALLGLPGCLILPIPTPEHGLVSGTGVVSDAETRLLEPGRTTRADVLLHFGQPSTARCGERILVYHWAVAHGWVIVAVGGPGAAEVVPIPIPKSYLVLFAFDAEGRLAHVARGQDLFAATPKPEPWLPADCLEPPTPGEPRDTLTGVLRFLPGSAIDATSGPRPAGGGLAALAPLRARIEAFADARPPGAEPNRLAPRRFETGPFGVWSYRRAVDLLRATVAEAWLAAGHAIGGGPPDVIVEGRVERIDLDVDWSWLAPSERRVELDLALRVQAVHDASRALERRYSASARQPAHWRGDAAAEWGAVLATALGQIGDAIDADAELARFLGRLGPQAE